MPYKRKAHVLFVGGGDTCRALLAAACANTLGGAWLAARAVTLQEASLRCAWAEHDFADQPLYRLDQQNIEWADLIVTLDVSADLACPPLPQNVQKRCYPFPSPENSEDLHRLRDAIEQRVAGMIGGMRMLG